MALEGERDGDATARRKIGGASGDAVAGSEERSRRDVISGAMLRSIRVPITGEVSREHHVCGLPAERSARALCAPVAGSFALRIDR